MEYLKPIEQLKSRIKFDQGIIFGLLILIGLLLVAVPQILKGEPYLVQTTEDLPMLLKSKPWKLSQSRIEGFSREYLEARFHFSPATFDGKKERLKEIVGGPIFSKLRDSMATNEALAVNQKAESYYTLESESFSSALDQAELHLTRVLRIRSAALATPLIVRLSLKPAPVTERNPYGFMIGELIEEEARESRSAEEAVQSSH